MGCIASPIGVTNRTKALRAVLILLIVTDLVLLVLRLLRKDLSELVSSMESVDLYNEG